MNKLLLLEDDISLIDGLNYSLKKNGFDIDVVRTVEEAKQHLTQIEKYDLLILDVTLPDWIAAGMITLPNLLNWGNYVPASVPCCAGQEYQHRIKQIYWNVGIF